MLETKVTELLGQLAEKLGVASAKIWEWSLLQVKVEIVTSVILTISAILATIVLAKVARGVITMWKKADKYKDGVETIFTIGFVIAVICVVSLDFIAFDKFIALPELLINPEYSAFKNIVEQLSKLK